MTVESRAARLGYGLVMNHAFLDGNKRIGLLAMLVFLKINGVVTYSDKELIALGLGLADGTRDDKAMLTWIVAHNLIVNCICRRVDFPLYFNCHD
jgi:death-on-curing protein